MFRSLLPRLLGETPPDATLSHDDAEVAIAALLVRIARADNHYGNDERRHIDALLARRRGLSEAPDTVRFTRAIKDRIPLDERAEVIGDMWEIALADGKRSADEDAAIRLAASLLGVTDVESARMRQKVTQSAR